MGESGTVEDVWVKAPVLGGSRNSTEAASVASIWSPGTVPALATALKNWSYFFFN